MLKRLDNKTIVVTENQWDNIIDTNLKGAFFCSQLVGRKMCDLEESCSIINISSQAISGIAKKRKRICD